MHLPHKDSRASSVEDRGSRPESPGHTHLQVEGPGHTLEQVFELGFQSANIILLFFGCRKCTINRYGRGEQYDHVVRK